MILLLIYLLYFTMSLTAGQVVVVSLRCLGVVLVDRKKKVILDHLCMSFGGCWGCLA